MSGYAEAFSSVQSDLQTSEWYSYFENALVTESGVNSYGICTVADKIRGTI